MRVLFRERPQRPRRLISFILTQLTVASQPEASERHRGIVCTSHRVRIKSTTRKPTGARQYFGNRNDLSKTHVNPEFLTVQGKQLRREGFGNRIYNVKVTLGKSDLLQVARAGCDFGHADHPSVANPERWPQVRQRTAGPTEDCRTYVKPETRFTENFYETPSHRCFRLNRF